jgi:oligopeptide transport system substrate-binding protein
MPGYSAEIGLAYNPNLARRLLTEAGYPNGHGFSAIDAYVTAGHSHLAAEYLQTRWNEDLDININWKTVSYGEYEELVRLDRPHLFKTGWSADYPDPDNLLRVALHQPENTWHDDRYEQLLKTARRMSDQSERLKLYQAADRLLIEEAAVIPLIYGNFHLLIKPWVKRHPMSPLSCDYWKDVIIEPH